MPVPRLDVRARRPPPQGAAQRGGAGLPAGRARPRARRGRHLGPVRLRERRRRPRAAAASARLAPGAGRRARAGRRLARPPLPLGGRGRGELEDRQRELPRVLPLPGRASRVQRADRRLTRGVPALDRRAALDPARPAADDRARRGAAARPVPLPLAEPRDQHLPRTPELLDRPVRAADARPDVPLPRLLLRPGRRAGVDRRAPRVRPAGRTGRPGARRGRAARRRLGRASSTACS